MPSARATFRLRFLTALNELQLERNGVGTMRPGQSTDGPYRVEVIADSSGKWAGNGLRFETFETAADYACDLYARWTLVRAWRVLQRVDGEVDDCGAAGPHEHVVREVYIDP